MLLILFGFLKMIKLLMILSIVKLYARNDIFNHIKKKHGQDLVKAVRDFKQEKSLKNWMRILRL